MNAYTETKLLAFDTLVPKIGQVIKHGENGRSYTVAELDYRYWDIRFDDGLLFYRLPFSNFWDHLNTGRALTT